jgi:hypothetical protein
VYRSIDLSNGTRTKTEYGFASGLGDDIYAAGIKQIPFMDYMDNFPQHPQGLIGLAKDLGKNLGLRASVTQLRKACVEKEWCVRGASDQQPSSQRPT